MRLLKYAVALLIVALLALTIIAKALDNLDLQNEHDLDVYQQLDTEDAH